VADGNRRQVVVFDATGNYVSAFGGKEGFKPTDVAVAGDKVYVSSVTDQRILIYNNDSLNLEGSFPEAEPGDPEYLYQPVNIDVSGEEIYVSDMGDNKIKVFTHDGKYLRSVGSYGNRYGQLTRPKGIALDTDKNLYIVDAAFENVQIFDKDGNLLMYFGGPYRSHGDMWLPAGITIDYENLQYFTEYVDESFDLQYLIFVTNQYGPDKISVYGFVKPAR
jgi:DNA-binding beta-propeller fold protein YncE